MQFTARSKQSVCAVILALAMSLLLVAAGRSAPSDQAAPGDQAFVYLTPALPLTFDPCFTAGSQTAEIMTNLYESWTRYSVGPLPKGAGLGGVAQGDITATGDKAMVGGIFDSWTVSKNGRIYTLHLRQGVRDAYGNRLTAGHVLWSIERISQVGGCSFVTRNLGVTTAPDAPTRLTEVRQRIRVINPSTLRVTLAGPNAIFLRILAVGNGSMVGPEARKHTTAADPWATGWLKTNAAATGPYKLESYSPGVQVVLVRNPNYYGPRPTIARVIYKQVDSAATRVAVLLSGQAHAARDLSQDDLNQVAGSRNAKVTCTIRNYMVNLTPNARTGPTAKPEVRRALAYAIPYDAIIRSVFKGRARRQLGMAPPIYPASINTDAKAFPYQKTDYVKAKQLLSAAGYPDGFNASVLALNTSPEQTQIAVLLQDSFKRIGVTLTIDSEPFASYTSLTQQHTFPNFAIWQNNSLVLDIVYHGTLFLNQGPPPNFNYGGWAAPTFNALASAAISLAAGPRYALLQRMQRIFNQNLPYLPLSNIAVCYGLAKNVSGYTWHTTNQIRFADLRYVG